MFSGNGSIDRLSSLNPSTIEHTGWDASGDFTGLFTTYPARSSTATSPIPTAPLALTAAPVQAAPVAPISDWYSQTFKDAGIANFVRQSYTRDNEFGRTDVINLFREIETNGVSAIEYQDCQTLIQDASTLKMPEYVSVLAAKVVGHNVANTLFQGNPLGDLRAGSTATQLESLVDKWFYGVDRPSTVLPATASRPERTLTYQLATGSLFGSDNAFNLTDIRQGDLGDCYFLAALGSTASQNPSAIQNLFIDNGDGTFTVRLFKAKDGQVNGVDYVTVDRYLPVVTDGGSTQRFAYYDNQTVGLWVALAEKAYAQFAEEQVSQRPATNGYVYNSYSSIEGGFAFQAMPSISGRTAGYYSDYDIGSGKSSGFLPLNQIASGLTNGWALTAGTVGRSDAVTDPATGIINGHEYIIYSVDVTKGTLWLYNPWGVTSSVTGDINGFKLVSYGDFVKDSFEIGIG